MTTTAKFNKFAEIQRKINKSIDPDLIDSDDSDDSEEMISDTKEILEGESEEVYYQSRCAAHKCTDDHFHKWKDCGTSYVYGPHICVTCTESFKERTSKKWKNPECKACRSLTKLASISASKPKTRYTPTSNNHKSNYWRHKKRQRPRRGRKS